MGILRVLTSVPIPTPLHIYSDAKSLLLHLQPLDTISEGKALQLGSGSIVRKIRSILQKRENANTTTRFNYVKAHTNNLDKYSKGNDLADTYAKIAANDEELNTQCMVPFTHNSPRELILIRAKTCINQNILHKHIDGNLRILLLNNITQEKLNHWSRLAHQGTVAMKFPKQLLHMIAYLRNHHHNTLLIFLLLASTQLLPTAKPLLQHLQVSHITKRCPLCNNMEATTLHTIQCPSLQNFRTRVYRKLKRSIGQVLRHLSKSRNPELHLLQQYSPTIMDEFEWYNPTYDPEIDPDTYFGVNAPENYRQTFREIAEEHHPLSACLGFIPKQLQSLLYPPPETLGLPPEDYNLNSRNRTKMLLQLQIRIMTATKTIFNEWQKLTYHHYRINLRQYPRELLQYQPGHLYRTFNNTNQDTSSPTTLPTTYLTIYLLHTLPQN